jgi:virginiamycin B lyase
MGQTSAPYGPCLSAHVTEFAVPSAFSGPAGITVGSDGALWFAENNADKIGRITTGGSITEYSLPTSTSSPIDLVSGSDGALWIDEQNQIGRITTRGSITQFSIPTQGSSPNGITPGPDGALWFAEGGTLGPGGTGAVPSSNQFGRITTGGSITGFAVPIPTPTSEGAFPIPRSATAGPDGNLWFTVATYVYFYPAYTPVGGLIARVTTGGAVTEFRLPVAHSVPEAIVSGPDGALWFTQTMDYGIGQNSIGNEIGRITTGGSINEYPIVDAISSLEGITRGPDGALWFADSGGCIGRITTSGIHTQFAVPTTSGAPFGIVTGPDGAIWFTEYEGNNIGRLVPS